MARRKQAETAGGSGGGYGYSPGAEVATVRDARMVEKAIRQRWPIPDEKREEITTRIINLVTDSQTPLKIVAVLFKALVSADSLNLKAEEGAKPPSSMNIAIIGGITLDLSRLSLDQLRQLRQFSVEAGLVDVDPRGGIQPGQLPPPGLGNP